MNKEFKVINFDSINSTNTFIKENYDHLDDLTIVFSQFQESGHGRNNRKWFAKKGESLLFSILFKDKKIIEKFKELSLMSGCYILKFLSKYSTNLKIKWPNDVFLNGKKITGILLEGVSYNSLEAIVLGIGININNIDFDEEIAFKATSLRKETNKIYDLEELKIELLKILKEMVNDMENDSREYLNIIQNHNYLKDKFVYASINNETKLVKVIRINEDNTLQVIDEKNNVYNLMIGEVIRKEDL